MTRARTELAELRAPDRRGLLAELRERIAELRAEAGVVEPGLREAVRDLVVIASSSRGGSSVFAELLRHAGGPVHFRAEINPWLALGELAYPESGESSDELVPERLEPAILERLDPGLSSDIGVPLRRLDSAEDVERFALDLAVRLTLQWPACRFALAPVRECLGAALSAQGGGPLDLQRLHLDFLAGIRTRWPAVNPYYYDLDPAKVGARFPELAVPEGPPGELIVEEPPFVTIGPWRRPSARELAAKPLVVKTPSNVYRLAALRRIFPNAQLRILHLTRNAAASINGLYDGWRYRGFFSHRLPGQVGIPGYSDQFAWGRDWWKFDLPPRWREQLQRPLEDVCAFQWVSAHCAVRDYLRLHPGTPSIRVRFEDAVGEVERRIRTFERLGEWLGLGRDGALERAVREGLPPVMATTQPRQRRWFAKAALLEPALACSDVRRTMEELGYDADPETWV